MPWPTPQDYNEAIQNPRLNFDDPELKAGTPELTPLGLPRPITGGFASVYRMQCGQRDWAVRCFLREYADQQRRYAAISQHLAKAKLPYTVGFEFLPQGIKIRGLWYPILKMEWVQGEPLNVYIEKHLSDAGALRALASRWQAMTGALRQESVAHGDLQHGNILVANGDLKLIDYDGMFVPSLAGQFSHEIGHRNYQHPRRAETDFGPYLDHFSAWVIYLSLLALSAEPGLWQQAGAGDEHLLLRKDDFDQPDASPTLAHLCKNPDEQVQALAKRLPALLCCRLPDIPALDSATATIPAVRRRFAFSRWKKRLAMSKSVASAPATPAANPPWLADQVAQSGSAKVFRAPMSRYDAVMLLLAPSAGIGLAWLTWRTEPLPSLFVGTILILGLILLGGFQIRYAAEPIVKEKRDLLNKRRRVGRTLASIERTLQRCEQGRAGMGREEIRRRETLAHQKQALESHEHDELALVHDTLKRARDAIKARRKALEKEEAEALEAVKARFGARIEALEARIEALEQAKAGRIAARLERRQSAFLDDFLRKQPLGTAHISGIGRMLKMRLWLNGFMTAADISEERLRKLRGIGDHRLHILCSWRRALEGKARAELPDELGESEARQIGLRYDWRLRPLEARRQKEQTRLATATDALRSRFTARLQQLDTEQSTAQTRSAKSAQAIADKYAARYAALSQSATDLTASLETERRQLEAQEEQARKELPLHHRHLTALGRELETYSQINLREYVRAIFTRRA